MIRIAFFFLAIFTISLKTVSSYHEKGERDHLTGFISRSETRPRSGQFTPQETIRKSACPATVAYMVCDRDHGEVNQNLALRIKQLIVSLKSIVVAQQNSENIQLVNKRKECVDVKLMTDSKIIFDTVDSIVQTWNPEFKDLLSFYYVPIVYASGYERRSDQKQNCNEMELFLDKILVETDAVIYVKTDFVFVHSVQNLWAEFRKFDPETVAAIDLEFCHKENEKCNRHTPHVFSSSIMLLNLTRMREIQWTERIEMVTKLLAKTNKFGQQKILNAYFNHFPRQLKTLPSQGNFKPENCKDERNGISTAQGLKGHFFQQEKETLKAFCRKLKKLELEHEFSLHDILYSLKKHNESTAENFSEALPNFSMKAVEQVGIEEDSQIQMGHEFRRTTSNKQTGAISTGCIVLCLTFCESRQKKFPSWQFNQTVVLLKSLVLMEKLTPSPKCINVVMLSDNVESFNRLVGNIMGTWDSNYTKLLHFTFVSAGYSKDFDWMNNEYKPCATLRLNHAEFLPEYDAVIHVDTDMIFTRAPSELWAEFSRFSEETVVIMPPKYNLPPKRRQKKSYYWPTRFQSGIMLMNLTRMRQVGFSTKNKIVSTFFRKALKQPVQVSLGIYFHHFPEQITLLNCSWNYVPKYCTRGLKNKCQSISAIHGVNSTFGTASTELLYHKIFTHLQDVDMTNPDARVELQLFVTKFNYEFLRMKNNRKVKSSCLKSTKFRPEFLKNIKAQLKLTELPKFSELPKS